MVTRRDAAADFFGEENVPREAMTMGVATILEAREIAILATGEHKSAIVRRAVEGDIAVDVAATFLQRHPATTFFVDEAAAADLTRIATPWMLDEVAWHEALIIRAVTWLSLKTQKAILKLTLRDYAEHHLSSLVARFGSAGEVNGHVFNALGAKIKGRSKLPQGKRIICFSPHPDDDVISMGGILRKLVLNENEITRRLHDERQHRRLRSRRAPLRGFPRAPGTRPPARRRRHQRAARPGRWLPRGQASRRRGQRGDPGHQAHHPRVGGDLGDRDARHDE